MYPQEETTQNIGNLVGGPVGLAREVSPLSRVINAQGEQIDKLGSIISELEQRLSAVHSSSPNEQGNNAQTDRIPASPLVDQVSSQVAQVQYLQIRLRNLLSELEV